MYRQTIFTLLLLQTHIFATKNLHEVDILEPKKPLPAEYESNKMHVKIPIIVTNDKERKISLRIDDANLNKYNQARRHIIKDKVLADSNKIREDVHKQDTTLKLTENNARRLINNYLKLRHDALIARRNNDHDNIDMREINARRNLEHSDHNNLESNGEPSILYNIRRYANNNEKTNHNFRRDNIENQDLIHRENLEHNTDGRRQGLILLYLDEDHNNKRNENIQQNFDGNDNEFKNYNGRRLLGYIPNKEKYRPNIILLSLNNSDLKEFNAILNNNYMENRRNFQRVKSQGHSYAEAIQESNLLNHLKKIRRGKARRDDKNDEEELRYDLEDDRLIWNIE